MLLLFNMLSRFAMGFPDSSVGKEFACNARDLGSIPGLGRSPGEGKGYSLQYSGLENHMDCIVHGIANSWTRLSDFHFTSLQVCNSFPFKEQTSFNFMTAVTIHSDFGAQEKRIYHYFDFFFSLILSDGIFNLL